MNLCAFGCSESILQPREEGGEDVALQELGGNEPLCREECELVGSSRGQQAYLSWPCLKKRAAS